MTLLQAVWCFGAAGMFALSSPLDSRSCLDSRKPAVVRFSNQTDTPIYVYLNGRYCGCCESFSRLMVAEDASGRMILLGRFRCDQWGPTLLRVQRGSVVMHTFTEADRGMRGEPQPITQPLITDD